MNNEVFLKYRPRQVLSWLAKQPKGYKLTFAHRQLLCLLDALATWQSPVHGGRTVVQTAEETCARLGCSRATYLRWRKDLVLAGVITVEHRQRGGRSVTPSIHVHVPSDLGSERFNRQSTEKTGQIDKGREVAPKRVAADYSFPVSCDEELKAACADLDSLLADNPNRERVRQVVSEQLTRLAEGKKASFWDASELLPYRQTEPGTPLWLALRRLTLASKAFADRAVLGHRPAYQADVPKTVPSMERHVLERRHTLVIKRWAHKNFGRTEDVMDRIKQAAFSSTVGVLRDRPLSASLAIIKHLVSSDRWKVPYGYAPELVKVIDDRIEVHLPPNHAWRAGASLMTHHSQPAASHM